MRLTTVLMTCLCSTSLFSVVPTNRALAQPVSRNVGAEADPTSFIGQEIRVTTVTGAIWPGRLTEVTPDRLTVQGGGGGYTISRSTVQAIEVLNSAPRPQRATATATGAASLPDGGEFRIHGSNTMGAQMVPNLVEAYGQAAGLGGVQVTPGQGEEERKIALGEAETSRAITVELHAHGTGTAFTSLISKSADLGMASRPVNDKEREAVMAAGLGDLRSPSQEHVVGLDGLSVVVNPANPVATLTLTQLGSIFTGALTDWSQVGGPPGRIQVYARDVKSGTYDTFNELVLRRRRMVAGARNFESSAELSDEVSRDPNGIGFIGFAYIRATRALTVSQSCGLAVPTEPFTVRTEEYPLARRLFIYNPAQTVRPAEAFLTFVRSAQAQPVVAAAGFINLMPELATVSYSEFRKRNAPENSTNPDARPETPQSQAIVQGLRALFSEAQRLSITFRFQTNSSALDTRGEADIDRLLTWSREPANANRQVVLVGYSSSVGSFDQNVALSRGRADGLARRLQAAGLRIGSVVGAGPVAAVACNSDDHGQALNRRVEVWTK